MYISVVTMEGNVFLLHGGSFFPVSFSLSSDIESTLFLPPPNPLFLVIQRTESSRQLCTASLSFGSFSLHPAVFSSPEMELILGGKKPAPRYRQTESPLEDVSTVFPPSGELAGTVFGASFFPPIRSRSFIGPSFPSRRNSHYPRRNRGGDGSLDSRQQLAHCAICAM